MNKEGLKILLKLVGWANIWLFVIAINSCTMGYNWALDRDFNNLNYNIDKINKSLQDISDAIRKKPEQLHDY